MTAYPDSYPQPLLEGFSAMVAMGVIRSDMPSHQAQRRVYTTMPHTFSLTFVMSVTEWALWYQWAGVYGYRWFTMNLPTLYAGQAGDTLSPVLIRFNSDISAVSVSTESVQVTVSAETAPSMIGTYLGAV